MGQHEEDQLIIQRLKDEMRQMDALMVSVSKNDDAEILRLKDLLDEAKEGLKWSNDCLEDMLRKTKHNAIEKMPVIANTKQLLTKLGGV